MSEPDSRPVYIVVAKDGRGGETTVLRTHNYDRATSLARKYQRGGSIAVVRRLRSGDAVRLQLVRG